MLFQFEYVLYIFYVLVTFLLATIKCLRIRNLRKERVVPGSQSIVMGNSSRQECEGTGPIVPTARKQRAMNACV